MNEWTQTQPRYLMICRIMSSIYLFIFILLMHDFSSVIFESSGDDGFNAITKGKKNKGKCVYHTNAESESNDRVFGL